MTKQELYAENRALKAELARTTAKLDASLAELQAMRVRFDQLLAQEARNNERLEELTAFVKRRSGKPAKPPAPAAPTALDDASKAAYEARPKAPELPAREPKPKAPRKPTGRKALPAHLPVEEHVFRPDACAHCGGTMLDLADEVVEEKLHLVEAYHRRRVVRRKTCRCRGCGERTTARSLPAPYERSKVTSAWLAWLVHQKFSMLAPLDRLRRDLASQGINLAMSTLVGFIERGADLLEAINGYHWRQLLAGRWMATDGTGLKVLVPTLKAAHNGYLEVYRRDDLVVLQYEPTKDAATLEAKLAPFKGTLLSDAEHRFNGVHARPDIEEAGCNAHGRRKFRDAEAVQPTLAAEGGAFIAAMYEAEGRAREQGLQGEALRDWRQTRIRPVAESFKAWLKATKPTLIPTDPLAAAVRYYENHWDALLRFVDNPLIPIDNSASEREFQNVAKLRLNMLFAGGTEGAHRAATLLGVVGTCRAIGLNAQAYLTWVFDRVGTHRDLYALPLERLTPAAYKASLAA